MLFYCLAGGNTLLLSMWGHGSATAVQFVHCWFGVGMTLAPIFAAPFMSPTHCAVNGTNSTNATGHHNGSLVIAETHIQIPYAVSGSIGIIGGVIFIIFYLFKWRLATTKSVVTNRKWRELFSPATCADGKLCFGTIMMLLLFLIYLFLVSKDVGLTVFLEPLAVDSADFTKTEGAILLTAYSATYTVARFISTGLGLFVPLNWMYFLQIIGNLGAAIALSLLSLGTKWHLWVFVSLFGLFAGPIYPSGMAWANQYVEMTAMGVAVIDFGIGIGAAVTPWLCGYLLTYVGPMYPIYFSMLCAAALLVLATVTQILGSCNGRRDKRE
jgi:FHS family Na+ dependent glucose MFS transporter 1